MKIMVTTYPFGAKNDTPIKQLEDFDVYYNDVKRKYTPEELVSRLKSFQPDIIIAGTEKYTKETLELVPNLQMISRVGIGLDSIPIDDCIEKNITVTYTPDAPSNSVAELTICQMINAVRNVQVTDNSLRNGGWSRYIGKEIRDCTIGIIGCGRIGSLVVEKLEGLKPRRIYVNDTDYSKSKNMPRSEFAKKNQILSECDIVSIHIPFSEDNENYLNTKEFNIMKKDACVINMSRGGIINEKALYKFLKDNPEASGCVDAFDTEPYTGKLLELENAYLTPHLGSCSTTSRFHMEVGAVEEVLNFINKDDLINKVC